MRYKVEPVAEEYVNSVEALKPEELPSDRLRNEAQNQASKATVKGLLKNDLNNNAPQAPNLHHVHHVHLHNGGHRLTLAQQALLQQHKLKNANALADKELEDDYVFVVDRKHLADGKKNADYDFKLKDLIERPTNEPVPVPSQVDNYKLMEQKFAKPTNPIAISSHPVAAEQPAQRCPSSLGSSPLYYSFGSSSHLGSQPQLASKSELDLANFTQPPNRLHLFDRSSNLTNRTDSLPNLTSDHRPGIKHKSGIASSVNHLDRIDEPMFGEADPRPSQFQDLEEDTILDVSRRRSWTNNSEWAIFLNSSCSRSPTTKIWTS